MVAVICIRNRPDTQVLIDEGVLNDLKNDQHLSEIGFLDNLMKHSNGYPYFQRYRSYKESPKYETIYLHKLIAERYLKKPETTKKMFVRFIDGNLLNVQLNNLEWVTMNTMRRDMKGRSTTGYRGVTADRGKYRAVLYVGDKKYDLGFFDEAVEAAKAYNDKSIELFGVTKGLNKIDDQSDLKT